MFCDRCGRLRNRATGKCVCDDDPTLAVPVAPQQATASQAETTEVNGVLSTAVLTKEVADAAVAARQVTALNGRAIKTAVEEESEPPPPPPAPVATGRLRSAIGDLRSGRHRYDVRIHDDAIVVDRVPGLDPLLAGRVAGAVLLGPLGYLVGDALGRRLARRRRFNRLAAPPETTTAVTVPLPQVVAITLQHLPWGGTLRIGAGNTFSNTLRLSSKDNDVMSVAGQFEAVVGKRFSLVPGSDRLALAYRAGRIALVLLAILTIALPVKAIVFPAAQPGDDLPAAARNALRSSCPAWKAAPLRGSQLAATAAQVAPDFQTAASASTEFATLGDDIALVKDFAPKAGTTSVPLTEAAAFSAAVDRIDAACARVGA